MLKPPRFVIGETVRILEPMFENAISDEIGMVTFREMRNATGLTSRDKLYAAIRTIVSHMKRRGVRFINEKDIGYRKATNHELATTVPDRATRHARSTSRHAVEDMELVDENKLSTSDRTHLIVKRQVHELMLAASRPRTIKNIEQTAMRTHNSLTSEEQIEAIRDALKGRK